ncbi:MAG: hypothetical protein ACHP65_04390 [Legionellales bacterium]
MKKIQIFLFLCLLGLCISNSPAKPSIPGQEGTCPQFPYLKPEKGPLALMNCDMHEAYEARIKQIMAAFGRPSGRPIILNLAGVLVLKYQGKTERVDIAPKAYHELKSFGHLALSVFLILSSNKAGALDPRTMVALKKIQGHLAASTALIPKLNLPKDAVHAVNQLANITSNFIETTIKHQYWTAAELVNYYKKLMPTLDLLLDCAAKIQVDVLDTAVNHWLIKITSAEKKRIGIVVATSHQARAQDITVTFFAKKFAKHLGIGAIGEDGLVVMEDKFDELSALKLLARHYLDREIGQAVFQDPESLQHDLLAGH